MLQRAVSKQVRRCIKTSLTNNVKITRLLQKKSKPLNYANQDVFDHLFEDDKPSKVVKETKFNYEDLEFDTPELTPSPKPGKSLKFTNKFKAAQKQIENNRSNLGDPFQELDQILVKSTLKSTEKSSKPIIGKIFKPSEDDFKIDEKIITQEQKRYSTKEAFEESFKNVSKSILMNPNNNTAFQNSDFCVKTQKTKSKDKVTGFFCLFRIIWSLMD